MGFSQKNFIDRFYNSEWTMGTNNGVQNATIKDDWTGEFKQVMLVWFEIKGKVILCIQINTSNNFFNNFKLGMFL